MSAYVELYLKESSGSIIICQATISDLPKYFHLCPPLLIYGHDDIDDDAINLIVQLNPKYVQCNTKARMKMHNALQAKMANMQLAWTPDLVVTPDSAVEYIITSVNYENFPYDVAKKIIIMGYGSFCEQCICPRLSGNQYESITFVDYTGEFPRDVVTNELIIRNIPSEFIPQLLRNCQATTLILGWISNAIILIDFDGELSETLMKVSPHLNDNLQRILEQRRTDFANRRFARVKAIVN